MLFGCGGNTTGLEGYFYYLDGKKPVQQDYSGQIVSFVYRFEQELGPSGRFELFEDGDNVIFRAWEGYYREGAEPYETRADKSVLQDLKELVDRCDIARYNRVVQDSGMTLHCSFLLEAAYDNGAEILTFANNNLPEAHDELYAFFMRIVAENNYFDGEIQSISYCFSLPAEYYHVNYRLTPEYEYNPETHDLESYLTLTKTIIERNVSGRSIEETTVIEGTKTIETEVGDFDIRTTITKTQIDKSVLGDLKIIVDEHRIRDWNGFDGQGDALDEIRFDLFIWYDRYFDQSSIRASNTGSNEFPNGFSEAHESIIGFFEALL